MSDNISVRIFKFKTFKQQGYNLYRHEIWIPDHFNDDMTQRQRYKIKVRVVNLIGF